MYEFFDTYGLQALTLQAMLLRFFLAMLFGGVLGLERTRKRRAAGFRTNMLVCLGATMVMMTSQFLVEHLGGTDPARLGAQVISGIGFLGAGTILVTGAHQIKGLTTAAALWASACMGLAIGIGFYAGATIMFLTLLAVMTLFDFLQTRYVARMKHIRLHVIFEGLTSLSEFLTFCKEKNITVNDLETMRPPTENGVAALFMLRFQEKKTHGEVIEMLGTCPGLLSVEEV